MRQVGGREEGGEGGGGKGESSAGRMGAVRSDREGCMDKGTGGRKGEYRALH